MNWLALLVAFLMGLPAMLTSPASLQTAPEAPLQPIGPGLFDIVAGLPDAPPKGTEPVLSQVLGISGVPASIALGYATLAKASNDPVRDAARTLADEFGLAPDWHQAHPGLGDAGNLPREVQESVALLLYALADATALQQEAVEGVPAEDMQWLLGLPARIADGQAFDPQTWLEDLRVLANVDLTKLDAAGQILLASSEQALPTLRGWAASQVQAQLDWKERGGDDAVAAFLGQAGAPLEKAAALLVLEAHLTGLDVAEVPPLTELPAAPAWPGLPPQLRHLPGPLASGIGAIAGANTAATHAASLGDPALWIESNLRLLQVIQETQPTLEAWGLVFGQRPLVGKTPETSTGAYSVASSLGVLARDGKLVDLVLLSAHLQGAEPVSATQPKKEALQEALLHLYDTLGLQPSPEQVSDLERSTAHLSPEVRQGLASIVTAVAQANAMVQQVNEELTPSQRELLAAASAEQLTMWANTGDTDSLGDLDRLTDNLTATYHEAARLVLHAVQQATFGAGPSTASSSQAQGDPALPACSDLEVIAPCDNDVLFNDPFNLVVLTGTGTSIHHPELFPQPVQSIQLPSGPQSLVLAGQAVTVDLGGDDQYENRAGGTYPVFKPGAAGAYDPLAVAISLDLGGNDRYLPAASAAAGEYGQGAGIGGVGILVDVSGNDFYGGTTRSQAFGSSPTDVQDRPELGCEASLSCVGGAYGLGFLADLQGSDLYNAQGWAQAAVKGTALGQPRTHGAAILVDADGDDRYLLSKTSSSAFGQGATEGGFALLADGGGNDEYSNGQEGHGDQAGLGILVDLNGQDRHDRFNGQGNAQCMAGIPFYEGGTPQAPDPGTLLTQPDGFSVFADFEDGGCTVALPDGLLPSPPPAETIIKDATTDSDGDGWTDALETYLATVGAEILPTPVSWDPGNPNDYPAGIPKSRPDGWPAVLPYPPAGQGPLYGSPYVVQIPGLLVVGDGGPTPYQPSKLHQVTLDLGGSDLYLNGPTGTLAIDFGEADDVYLGGDGVQGADGLLLDLGGNDVYVAGSRSQGAIASAIPPVLVVSVPLLGGLLDAGGDDIYVAGDDSQGSVRLDFGSNALPQAYAFLLDIDGDDSYRAPGQGTSSGAAITAIAAVFADLAGDDLYQPIGKQGHAVDRGSSTLVVAGFLDGGGDDTYVGTLKNVNSPDQSRQRNDRLHLQLPQNQGVQAGVSFFWDTEPQHLLGVNPGAADPGNPTSILDIPELGVRVASAGNDLHGHDYTLLIEPGGSDTYTNHAGSSLVQDRQINTNPTSCPCEASFDSTRPKVLPGLLLELAGDDTYLPPVDVGFDSSLTASNLPLVRALEGTLAQGAGFLGAGLLIDEQGNDKYSAAALSQGAAAAGVGILWDRAGDDMYQADANVVRSPMLRGQKHAWQEPRGGYWHPRILDSGFPSECSFDPMHGLRQTSHPAMAIAQDWLVFSVRDSGTGLWNLQKTSTDQTSCQHVPVAPVPVALDLSNQINPATQGRFVAWQDDRAGDWDIYLADLTGSGEEAAITGPGNQVRPAIAGPWIAWEDDQPGGTTIQARPLASSMPIVLSSELPGIHTGLTASSDSVAWTYLPQGEADWDVVVYNFTKPPSLARTWLQLPGDQLEPALAGQTVAYVQDGDLVAYDLAQQQGRLQRTADQPSFDRLNPLHLAWRTMQGPRLHGFNAPFAHAQAGLLDQSQALTLNVLNQTESARLLQGAAWFGSMGLLVEEGGLDSYSSGFFSQGASFAGTSKPQDTFARLVQQDNKAVARQASAMPGGQAALLDLEGNDRYEALNYSQGATVGVTTTSVETPANGGEPTNVAFAELAANQGLLVDVSGADSYTARHRSQGYGEFVLGSPVARRVPLPNGPGSIPFVGQLDYPVVAYLADSLGAFFDLGGLDSYTYAGTVNLQTRPGIEPGGTDRNGWLWSQTDRRDGRASNIPFGTVCQQIGDDCVPTIHVGGIGLDDATSDVPRALAAIAASQAIHLDLQTRKDGAPTTGTLDGQVEFRATPSSSNAAVQVRRMEFFVASKLVGYGSFDAACSCYRFLWDSTTVPDGDYDIMARAQLALPTGPALAYVEAILADRRIDNPSRIVELEVSSDVFSPAPFAFDAPSHPQGSFTVPHGPTGPDSRVQILVEDLDGRAVAELRSFDEPLQDETVSFEWTGLDSTGTIAPSGDYVIHLLATDRPSDPTRPVGQAHVPVALDATRPVLGCVLLPGVPCNGDGFINLANAVPAGSSGKVEALVSLLPSLPDPGIHRIHMMTHEPGGAWQVHSSIENIRQIELNGNQALQVLVLLEDRAGNLECLPSCDDVPANVQRQETPTNVTGLEKARDTKLKTTSPAFANLTADLDPPRVNLGGTPFTVNDADRFTLDGLPRVGALAKLNLSFVVTELQNHTTPSGMPLEAHAEWSMIDGQEVRLIQEPFGIVKRNDTFLHNYNASWSNWPEIVEVIAPDGQEGDVQVAITVRDGAGNVVGPFIGNVLLDRTAPVFPPDPIQVVYPDEERTFASAGDLLALMVRVSDPPLPGSDGQPGELRVFLDASSITGSPDAANTEPEATNIELIRVTDVDGATFYEPRGGLLVKDVPEDVASLPIVVTAVDEAGNAAATILEIPLGGPDSGISLADLDPQDEQAYLNFTTDKPATVTLTVFLQDSTDPLATYTSPPGTRHEFLASGLRAGTAYLAKVKATIDGSSDSLLPPPTFETTSGLSLEIDDPAPGDMLSGIAPVRLSASTKLASAEPPIHVVLRLVNETGFSKVLHDSHAQDGGLRFDLVTDAFPDGTYSLQVVADAAGESRTNTVQDLILDNTAPTIVAHEPTDQSTVATAVDRISLLLTDELAGVDATRLEISEDGTLLPLAGPTNSLLGELGINVTAVLAQPLKPGLHRLVVRGYDLAGNVASTTIHLAVDDSPPDGNATLQYPNGHAAAKPGDMTTVVLHPTTPDVRSAWINATFLDPVQLHFKGLDLQTAFLVPPNLPDGGYPMTIILLDLAGNLAEIPTILHVDGTAPTIEDLSAMPQDATSARIVVNAPDALRAQVRVVPDLETTIRQIPEPGLDVFMFQVDGLVPGRQYIVQANVTDAAGNEATRETALATVGGLSAAVPAVGGLRAEAWQGHVKLTWDTLPPVPGQRPEVSVFKASDGLFNLAGTARESNFLDWNVTAGTTYTYFVQAIWEDSTSPATPPVQVTVPANPLAATARVSPSQGVAERTSFRFQVEVEGAILPEATALLVVEGRTHLMQRTDKACMRDCTFEVHVTLPALTLDHPAMEYHVEIAQQGSLVRVPEQGELQGPSVVVAPQHANATPGPAWVGLGAVLIALTLWRRRA